MKSAELVTFPARNAEPFPVDGRRLLIYVVYDLRGEVESYIPYALTHLRAHCDRIVTVVNGALTELGRGVR
jgi:lipopolysaccharide biosynthesis protein